MRERLDRDALDHFETGARYQIYGGLGLLLLGVLQTLGWRLRAACWCMLVGTLVFAGSLHVLSLTGLRWLGAVTSIGGVLMLVAWLLVAIARRD